MYILNLATLEWGSLIYAEGGTFSSSTKGNTDGNCSILSFVL